jgi:hypothetical protein
VAIQIKSDGTFSIEYEGPYAGLDVQKPETLISDKASPLFNNVMLRNAELRSRPAFVQKYLGAAPFQLGISSFIDINGIYHTVTWAGRFMYQFDPALLPASPWVSLGFASPGNLNTFPLSFRTFSNTIYYTTISQFLGTILPFMGYWDGLSAFPVFTQTFSDASVSQSVAGISLTDSPTVGGSLPGGPAIVGPIAIGAQFLGELNNQLILANVSIKDQGTGTTYSYPNLMWWSANGLPLQWDPTQNTSAGFTFFLDVPDQITGLMTLGIAGFLFRNKGISQFAPTGSAITPWEFDHMWASDHGIGNVLPWSIAQYGPTGAFVAEDNIYTLSVGNVQPIGGTARDAIYADIANVPNIGVTGSDMRPFGFILPKYKNGFVYLTYNILLPFLSFCRLYVYSFEDKNWSPWDLPFSTDDVDLPQFTCPGNVV